MVAGTADTAALLPADTPTKLLAGSGAMALGLLATTHYLYSCGAGLLVMEVVSSNSSGGGHRCPLASSVITLAQYSSREVW